MALGKKERKKAARMLEEDRSYDTAGYGDFTNRFRDYGNRAAGVWGGAQDWGMNELRNLYGEMGEGGGGGGVPGYGGEYDDYLKWERGVRDLGATSPEQAHAMRGYGTFKDFAETGGWTPQQMQDFRARGNIGADEIYGGVRGEMERGRTVQGGYGPGYGTGLAKVARDRARAMGEQSLGVETNLANSIREGKKWGGSAGSAAEQQIFANQRGGQEGALGLTREIGNINRAAAASNAARRAGNLSDRMGLIGAYTDLARQTGGELDYGGMELQGRQAGTGARQGYHDRYVSSQQQGPSWWQKAAGALGGLAGAAGGVMTGLSAMRKP